MTAAALGQCAPHVRPAITIAITNIIIIVRTSYREKDNQTSEVRDKSNFRQGPSAETAGPASFVVSSNRDGAVVDVIVVIIAVAIILKVVVALPRRCPTSRASIIAVDVADFPQ
ncbi:uncharacterized protein V1516DRAFT_670036 [Lipomyces oligophaga]|uniref:uncharacterized protein n=1 Tax=Lipomyces oligophaga TaxID=45792 RepID=UPI0034CFCC28